MKIRTGFVSNSSSSSFIVEVGSMNYMEKLHNSRTRLRYVRKITKAQEKKLLAFGFKYTHLRDPMAVECLPYEDRTKFLHKTPGKKHYYGGKGYYEKTFGKGAFQTPDPPRQFSGRERDYLALQVACNEDEVASFLVVHNIPFEANTHYGHNYLRYDRDANYTILVHNLGQEIATYGLKLVEQEARALRGAKVKPAPAVQRTSVEEWRKERKTWRRWKARDRKIIKKMLTVKK